MAVVVTRKPGGITQLFNTETGRVTYKCKADRACMMSEGFGGIVRFNQRNAMATITGRTTELDSCDILKPDSPGYREALADMIATYKEYAGRASESHQKEILRMERMLAGAR